MVASWRGTAVAAVLSAVLPLGSALFEDEVGQYEWIVQQIGQPAALAYSADAADKVFIASKSGAVASMLLKDGTVHWRRTLSSPGSMRILKTSSRGLLSVADNGLLQAWKGSTGDLTWQREYTDRVHDIHVIGAAGKQNIVVVRESEIEVRTSAGKHEWSRPVGEANAKFWAAAPLSAPKGSETIICALSAVDGGAAKYHEIEASTGKVGKTTDVPSSFAAALKSKNYIVVNEHIVVLDSNKITSLSLCGGEPQSFDLQKIKTDGVAPFQLAPAQQTQGVFAATNGATTVIFGVGEKGLKQLRTFDGVAVVGPVHSVHEDEAGQPVAVAIVGDEGTKIQLLDPASGNVQPATNADGYSAKDHGPASLLFVKELSSGQHSTIISAADHSIASVQGTKVNWVREEALASIQQAMFYGMATTTTRARATEEAASLSAVVAQLGQLPQIAGELAKVPLQIAGAVSDYVASLTRSQNKKTKPVLLPNAKAPRAAEELRGFGGNKLIICVTRASKIYALEATTSAIVWKRYMPSGIEFMTNSSSECTASEANSGRIGKCGLWMQALPANTAAYTELLVVTPPARHAGQSSQQLHWLDPVTGKDLHTQAAPSAGIVSLIPLPLSEKEETQPIQPFIILDSKHKVHTAPANNDGHKKTLEQAAQKLFHFEVNRESQTVQGFAIDGGINELVRLWGFELNSADERIVAAALPEHREWDHVPVHIKGDASILYKYINPNMVAVVSEDVDKHSSTSLTMYVLDSVTGHVLHQSRIVGAAAPAHLALCDNWIVMHYWNSKRSRFELTVVELFEAKQDSGPWNILFGGKQGETHTTSAHHLETPVPLQQTYIFPAGVSAMGVTATLKGITPRSVILALSTDHLLSISKDVLNPRRPYMTAAGVPDKERAIPAQFAPTKEEPVPPYAPVMPLRPTDVLTYYNPIGNVAGIVSSPTALESTSIIFSYGLDLFFTPVQSAKAYDVLSPAFNYPLLFASVSAVVAGLLVTYILSERKAVMDRWK